jgi:hypothetical protein
LTGAGLFPIFHKSVWAVNNEKKRQPLAFFEKKGRGDGFLSFFRYQDDSFGFDRAHVAQLVEHILGKDEVISSILIMGSI